MQNNKIYSNILFCYYINSQDVKEHLKRFFISLLYATKIQQNYIVLQIILQLFL